MGKFDGVLLVSDFDDTIYNKSHTVSEENRAALARFRAQGGRFTIATGRAHPTFTPQIAKECLILDAPVVLSNGAAIYDYATDTYLRQTYLPESATADMEEIGAAFPHVGLEFYHDDDIYILHPNECTDFHTKLVGVEWTEAGRVADIPAPYVKLIAEGRHRDLVPVQQVILDRWGDRYEAIFSNVRLLEITRKGSTKGGMVAWLADYLGIRRENLYCVGDGSNDLSMLQVSAVPFAPENCAQELRDYGAHLLPHCDDHAIAALIEELEKRY